MCRGWIKMYRDIDTHWLWDEKPFDKRSAWLDMILLANHKENKFLLGSELVEVERGGFITSEIKLMERWGWSKSKVRSFLKVLEKDNMILKISDKKKTAINIVNYERYQDSATTERPHGDHAETTKEPQKDTNKNDNKEKKNISSFEIDGIWTLYPKKVGKAKGVEYIKKALKKYSADEIKRCIDRFSKEKQLSNTDLQFYMSGDRFFNTGYVDYLDSNYTNSNQGVNNNGTTGNKVYGFGE